MEEGEEEEKRGEEKEGKEEPDSWYESVGSSSCNPKCMYNRKCPMPTNPL